MTFAIGQQEMREKGEQIFKQMRLKRLQEVREQERRISLDRCQQYRGRINQHKRGKQEAAKEGKRKILMQAHDDLVYSWQQSVVDNGSAQRDAKENWVETVNRINDRSSQATEKVAMSLQRQRQALELIEATKLEKERTDADRARRILIRRELIASDREDAKAACEARKAKDEAAERQAMLALQSQAVHVHDKPVADKGSVVQARVMKHGATKADVSVISNRASVEENVVVKRLFKRCIDELRNKNKALARARVARKSTAVVQNVEYLEAELGLLLAYDRSPLRTFRIKNVSSVPPNEDGPVIVQSFEKVFLSEGRESVAETVSVGSYEETDESEDDAPQEPLRKSRELALRESNIALTAKAEMREQKRRDKAQPIRERVVKATVAAKKNAPPHLSDSKEDLAPRTLTVSIPVHSGAADGVHVASASSWHPTPVWDKVGGVETGYGLGDSISSASMLQAVAGGFVLDEEEIAEDLELRRASDAIPYARQGELDDSLDSLGLQSSALQLELDDTVAASAPGSSPGSRRGDVEITRGSTSLSPMRDYVRNSPMRMSLKDHSLSMSAAELHVSISSGSNYDGENTASINGEVDESRASTFFARHDLPANVLSGSPESRSNAGGMCYDTTLSASLEDSPFSRDELDPAHEVSSSFQSDQLPSTASSSIHHWDDSNQSSSHHDSSIFVSPANNKLEPEAVDVDLRPLPVAHSFHSFVSSSGSSTDESASVPKPSLTVRVTGAEYTTDFPTAQSVSFESLFMEESDEEGGGGNEDNEEEEEEEDAEEENEGVDDDEEGGRGPRLHSRRPDYTFFTANNNDSVLTASSSGDQLEMFTPHPFPPQMQQDGLGSFSRRPFRLVPSPVTTFTARPQESSLYIDEGALGLVDLLGLDRDNRESSGVCSTRSSAESTGSESSSGVDISAILNLGMEAWENNSVSSSNDSDGSTLGTRRYSPRAYEDRSNSLDSDNLTQDAKIRIEREIAEMRRRLLEAVEITAMSAAMSARALSEEASSNNSPASPFFHFNNQASADVGSLSSHQNLDTTGLLSSGALSSQLQETTGLSGGFLSSQSSGGVLSGGNLSSSLPVSSAEFHLQSLWGSSDSSLSAGSSDAMNLDRSILSTYSLNEV